MANAEGDDDKQDSGHACLSPHQLPGAPVVVQEILTMSKVVSLPKRKSLSMWSCTCFDPSDIINYCISFGSLNL